MRTLGLLIGLFSFEVRWPADGDTSLRIFIDLSPVLLRLAPFGYRQPTALQAHPEPV